MKLPHLLVLATGMSAIAFGQTFGSSELSRTVTLEARLTPLSENPVVTGRAASGTANITIRLDRQNTAATAASTGSVLVNISATTTQSEVVTAAHIHRGVAGVNGPVVVDFKMTTATTTVANQAAALTTQFEVTEADAVKVLEEVLANPAGFYVNVHTQSNPGGHIRGQLAAPVDGAVARLDSKLVAADLDLAELRRMVVRIAEKTGVISPQQRDDMLKALDTRAK